MDSECPLEDRLLAVVYGFDRQALAVLYDRYFAPLYNYIHLRCGHANTADELAAMVFERALRHIAKYCLHMASFKAWLFTIARNDVHDHLCEESEVENFDIWIHRAPNSRKEIE